MICNSPLKICDISYHYGSQIVLKNLSYEFLQGECVALTGPSGVGKSTFLHLCGTLLPLQTGDILIHQKSLRHMSNLEKIALRRKTIGFIYQFHHLIPELTIEENIALPLNIQGHTQPMDESLALLQEFSMDKYARRFPYQISGGECQRVAILRAFASKPSIILADEPTGNLDPETSQRIFNWMHAMATRHNTTLIFATHNLELAQKAHHILKFEPS